MKNIIKIVILASLISTAHAESYETFMTRRSQQAAAIHMRSSAAYAGNKSEPSGAGINERYQGSNGSAVFMKDVILLPLYVAAIPFALVIEGFKGIKTAIKEEDGDE